MFQTHKQMKTNTAVYLTDGINGLNIRYWIWLLEKSFCMFYYYIECTKMQLCILSFHLNSLKLKNGRESKANKRLNKKLKTWLWWLSILQSIKREVKRILKLHVKNGTATAIKAIFAQAQAQQMEITNTAGVFICVEGRRLGERQVSNGRTGRSTRS